MHQPPTNSYYHACDVIWLHLINYQQLINEMEVTTSIEIGESTIVENDTFVIDIEPACQSNSNT